MYDMGMDGTKWNIFEISVDLFSKKGYESVSVRDIANEAGIKSSSIYNHFKSKEEILNAIYDYFNYYYDYFLPPISQIISGIGKETTFNTVIKTMNQKYNGNKYIMDKIILIVFSRFYFEQTARECVMRNVFTYSETRLNAVFNALIDDKIIPPEQIDALVFIVNSITHSLTVREAAQSPVNPVTLNNSIKLICEILNNILNTELREK